MRKWFVLLGGMVVVLGLGSLAWAGDYHSGNTLFCQDCHVMHYSQTHGYNADGTGIYAPLGTAGPYTFLLRNEINALCLTCHNNQTFAPDVFETQTGAAVREAGALNRTTSTGLYNPAGGHSLYSTGAAPGGTFANANGLNCVDCHHQHGRTATIGAGTGFTTQTISQYRNLQPVFGTVATPVSYATGTNDAARDVFQRSATAYAYTDVDFNNPVAGAGSIGNAVSFWCSQCHGNFHGTGNTGAGPIDFLRHPSGTAEIGAQGGGHSSDNIFVCGNRTCPPTTLKTNWVKVLSASGNWTFPTNAATNSDGRPFCLSCHKGHGNRNAFGLIQMETTGAVTEEGTAPGQYVNVCRQCHVQ